MYTILVGLAVLNVFMGVLIFYFVMNKLKLHRSLDEARDARFPAWREVGVHDWNHFSLFIGAITIMPIRVMIFGGAVAWLGFY